jgi:GntR family transcriptional regulator
VSVLDRSSPLPLWAQLADDLRRRAAAGEFGERLPSEPELVAEYSVSRNTVREAMRRLHTEGLIRRQRGRGTTLVDIEIEQTLPGLYSLASTIEDRGLEERSDVLVIDTRPAGDSAAHLEVAQDTEVVYVERLRYAGREPLALARSWLPADLAAPLLDADLTRGSVYDALRALSDVRIDGGWERIAPAIPSPTERSALRLPRGQAVFHIERVASTGRRPVEWRTSVVRGDRYRLTSTWR